MIKQIKYEKLFYTPLMRYRLSNYEELNEEIMVECQRLQDSSPGLSKSNIGGWHSKGNLFDSDVRCIQHLRDAARESVYEATRKVTKKVDPESLRLRMFAWMNANSHGSYNAPHTHPMAHWSGVYYVSLPETESRYSGMVEFHDPRTDLPNWRILGGRAFARKRQVKPNAGELIIFPSYLLHWVYPNESDGERVSIAFNATFRKPIKKKHSS